MLKAFSKLWLEGAKRLAKVQLAQQKKLQRTLVRSLSPTAKKPRPPAAKRVIARARAVPTAARNPTGPAPSAAIKRNAGKRTVTGRAPAGAGSIRLDHGGSWTRAYHVSPRADSHGRHRRMLYWLFVPDTAVDATAAGSAGLTAAVDGSMRPAQLPLVVMLHGCEQTAEEFAIGTRMNRLAAQQGFAVLYPQQSASAHPQRCWPWYKRAVQQGGDEVALVASMLERVLDRHDFDRRRIYVAGLSAGAALAQALAVRHPQVFAAVGSHSGPVFGVADSRLGAYTVMQAGARDALRTADALLREQPDFPPMPMLILHGEQDQVVRPVNAVQLARQFRILNRLAPGAHEAPVVRKARAPNDAWRRTDSRHKGRVVVRLCEVANLAHAWSGGDDSLRYNTARGPDASVLLWDFFKRQRRR